MDEDGVALTYVEVHTSLAGYGFHLYAVDFDGGEGVVVDTEPEGDEGTVVYEAEAGYVCLGGDGDDG